MAIILYKNNIQQIGLDNMDKFISLLALILYKNNIQPKLLRTNWVTESSVNTL